MSREEARDASLACCRLGSVKETELLIGGMEGPQTSPLTHHKYE